MKAPSLRASAMSPFWEAVRDRLEREGVDNRGLLRVPTLDAAARLTLKNLLDRPKPPRRVDLGRLETALVALGVGADLPGALAALGFEGLVIARPSLLAGDRPSLGQPERRGERIGLALSRALGPLIPAAYRPIDAARVARALLALVPTASGVQVLSSAQMQRPVR